MRNGENTTEDDVSETTQPAGGTAENPTGPAPANAEFARMRIELDQANKAKAEAEQRLAAAERAKMDELERTKAELADANKRASDLDAGAKKAEAYAKTFEGLYQAELAQVPDDKRDRIAKLTAIGDWPERLEALREARSLIGSPPVVAGTVTQPGTQPPTGTPPPSTPPPDPKQPIDPKALGKFSLADAIATRPPAAESVLSGAQIEALNKRIEATIEQKLANRQ